MTRLMAAASLRRIAWFALPATLIACADKTPPVAKTDSVPVAPVVQPVTQPAAQPSPAAFRVAMETSKGTIVVEVKRSLAPLGADRFYELVQQNYFNDVRFFRVLTGFMAQFGMHGDPATNAQWSSKTLMDEPVLESNKRGTITFAKTGAPNSRSNQFFINFGDNSMLDAQGFSPFGHVVQGMDVVDKINAEYGESPDQGRIDVEGNAYLTKNFPRLDFIKSTKIVASP